MIYKEAHYIEGTTFYTLLNDLDDINGSHGCVQDRHRRKQVQM